MNRILICDDDVDTLDVTTYSLRKHGYQIVTALDGRQAVQKWQDERPDLVVLDVNMPRMSGFDVCRKIRESSTTPVIMVTAQGDEEHVVQGFLAGADDYVTKPFSHKQLAMRIRAVLQRASGGVPVMPTTKVTAAGLELDADAHSVTRDGQTVNLTPLEFKILFILASNEGRVVKSERIVEYAWNHDGADSSLLKTHVSHIRTKLKMKRDGGPYIKVMPWVGYKLEMR
jgi:DNA-binding response OmpR family regulator